MAGMVAVVLGATGNIGSGAARAFLQDKVAVVAPSRSATSLEKLKAVLGPQLATPELFFPVIADCSTPEGMDKVKTETLSKFGRIDHVTSSFGPWHQTPPMHEVSWDKWRESHLANYDSHFLAWRSLVPEMKDREGSTYTFVTGGAAENPQSGITGVCAHALLGFARATIAESADFKMRVNNVYIFMRIEDDATYEKMNPKSAYVMSSSEFGKIFGKLANSKNASVRGKTFKVDSPDTVRKFTKELA